MLKITLIIEENKKEKNCTLRMINPKDYSKATENEKTCCAVLQNELQNCIKKFTK